MFEPPLELDARFCRVLDAEAAKIRAHAGLHHAHAFGICLARRHSQVCPDLRQVCLLDAEQINALAAGNLHHRHLVFFGHVRDAPKFFRRSHASTDARHDRKRSVLLNIGVDAVVDEARRAIFIVVSAPQHVHHVTERRLADFAAHAVSIDFQNFLHRAQPLAPQNFAQLVLGK